MEESDTEAQKTAFVIVPAGVSVGPHLGKCLPRHVRFTQAD